MQESEELQNVWDQDAYIDTLVRNTSDLRCDRAGLP